MIILKNAFLLFNILTDKGIQTQKILIQFQTRDDWAKSTASEVIKDG